MKPFIIILLTIANCLSCITISSNTNTNAIHNLRNIGYKIIILKEKKIPKLLYKINNFYMSCYNKSLVTISECFIEYNKLSEEDKLIFDFIISSIL
jgi:vacuolar-type H+-ATPase subunit F/Vma7